jgi:hypothetical protein
MESVYTKHKSFNWDNIIRYRLTAYRDAATQTRTECCEHCVASQRHYSLERQMCIAAQQKIIFFGSNQEAEHQLKTYLLSPHMLDNNTTTRNLCYNGQKLFTKPMFEHFPTPKDTLTWNYHA